MCNSSVAKVALALETVHRNDAVREASATTNGKYPEETHTPNWALVLHMITRVHMDRGKQGTRKTQSHQMPPRDL
jgi:hypothetical protein